jgi:hypothetical protein
LAPAGWRRKEFRLKFKLRKVGLAVKEKTAPELAHESKRASGFHLTPMLYTNSKREKPSKFELHFFCSVFWTLFRFARHKPQINYLCPRANKCQQI